VDEYKRGLSLLWGTALRNFMDEHDITLVQVARLLDRSHGYVSQRTTGRESLSLDIIQAVAELAHLEPQALMIDIQARVLRASGRGASSDTDPRE
jgi:transcriptional regulator with XRE-family HTH domain